MIPKFSKQTKSFIILFVIAFLGAYVCLVMAKFINFPGGLEAIERLKLAQYQKLDSQPANNLNLAKTILPTDSATTVDTTGWKTYTDPTYSFSLNYPPQWQIKKPSKQDGFYVLTIDPGAKYFNVKIYVSPKGYFAMDNLPFTTITLAGEQAIDVEGSLYGLKHDGNYYTFDQGISQSIKPEFEAMVKSLKLTNY